MVYKRKPFFDMLDVNITVEHRGCLALPSVSSMQRDALLGPEDGTQRLVKFNPSKSGAILTTDVHMLHGVYGAIEKLMENNH